MIWMQTISEHQSGETEDQRLDRLILGIAAGETESLAELYSRTRAAVYGLALTYLKNTADAEDVTQDTFVKVWQAAEGFHPQGHPMAWLMTITRNQALGRLRKKSREEMPEQEEWEKLPAPDSGLSTEDRAFLDGLLARLSEEESRIVALHAVAGLKHREIARIMDLALPTVLSKYHRALKKLKIMMEGENRS